MYGFDRLEALLRRERSSETDAEAWLEGILEEVRGFSDTAPQHDDMTLVVLKVGAEGSRKQDLSGMVATEE